MSQQLPVLLHPWNGVLWRQLGLSMVIPFFVSLTSSVLTRRELLAGASAGTPRRADAPSSVEL